jgi:hypothetical protein
VLPPRAFHDIFQGPLIHVRVSVGPIRLLLEQTAEHADANGVFSGNCPEGGGITDYALLWFEAYGLYLQATGDVAAATGLYPSATKCMDYFISGTCYEPSKGFAIIPGSVQL